MRLPNNLRGPASYLFNITTKKGQAHFVQSPFDIEAVVGECAFSASFGLPSSPLNYNKIDGKQDVQA
jgi:hypothetical protein